MQLPQININGTSQRDLQEGYLNARKALSDALKAMSDVWPHGRDYQTLPPGAAHKAMEEHADRMARLRSVLSEIDIIAEHLA